MPVASLEEMRVNAAPEVAIRDAGPYSARNSSKGALVDEAARIFQAMARGASIDDVREQSLRGRLLSQRSSVNRSRIWSLVQQRYLIAEAPWLMVLLAEKAEQGTEAVEFTSLLYLLYALRDRVSFDFVTTVLWPKGSRGRAVVSRNDVLDLLKSATPQQPQVDRWSEATRTKLAGSVLTALRDFGVLVGRQKKYLVQPPLPLSTAAALLRVLIAEGRRGRQVLQDDAWRLFLLTEAEVAQLLATLAREGVVRFEKVGTTVVLETPAAWESES